MKLSIVSRVLAACLLLLTSASGFAGGVGSQTSDVFGQGPGGPVVAEGGATLIRTAYGITAALKMPTPEPGSYDYPPTNDFQTVTPVAGTPEVFTGWFFFFNDPANCAVPHQCVPPPPGGPAPNDFTTGRGGVYNFAGHAVSGGGTLNLVGHIAVGERQFGGPYRLENPEAAEVHLAVAPHGVVVPALLPQQIRTPVGNPNYWWIALFDAP